jgi:hypothetical protein
MPCGVTTRCAWPGTKSVCYRTNAFHELLSPLAHLLQWQTCITVLDCHWSMNFDGFHPFTTLFFFGACSKRGRPSLHYYCAVVLHSCTVLPPVSGFGGLVVSMLASVTQVCGFAKPSDFFGRKNPQHVFLRKGKKPVWLRGSRISGKIIRPFPAPSSLLLKQRAPRSSSMGAPGVDGRNQKAPCTKGQYNKGLGAYRVTRPLTNLSIYCHLSAAHQTMSNTVVNLQDNLAVFRIFIAL